MTDPLKHQIQTAAGIGYAESDVKVKNLTAVLDATYAALGVEAAHVPGVVARVINALPDPVTAAIETLHANTYRLTEAHRQALLEILEEASDPDPDPETFQREPWVSTYVK
jgi:hypothetical protein